MATVSNVERAKSLRMKPPVLHPTPIGSDARSRHPSGERVILHVILSEAKGRYRVTALVYVERTTDVHAAIACEKQLNVWTRARKIALIEAKNPTWRDLHPERVRIRAMLHPGGPSGLRPSG